MGFGPRLDLGSTSGRDVGRCGEDGDLLGKLLDVRQRRMDPIMKKVLSYYPDPTLPISPTLNVNWSQNFASPSLSV